MKISVITVSYNSADTIVDTLKSVATQSHRDIEHIVIDGGSSDMTLQRIRDHGQHVSVLLSEPDRGIYDAMNKGLARATGDVVGFLNADDVFADPETLAAVSSAFASADVVYGNLVYVNASQIQRIIRLWAAGEFLPSRLKYGWMPPHPTFYLRRSRFAGMRFNVSYRIAADYDFMLRCLLTPGLRIRYLPRVVVRMRTGGASNRSLIALWRKSSEDLHAIRKNGVGGWATLLAKNLRKLPQFFRR